MYTRSKIVTKKRSIMKARERERKARERKSKKEERERERFKIAIFFHRQYKEEDGEKMGLHTPTGRLIGQINDIFYLKILIFSVFFPVFVI